MVKGLKPLILIVTSLLPSAEARTQRIETMQTTTFCKHRAIALALLIAIVPSGWGIAQPRQAIPIVANAPVDAPFVAARHEPVDEMLAREIFFIVNAGQLSIEQSDAIEVEARKALIRWNVTVGNIATADALRRELAPLLKDISQSAWDRFDREQMALDARRKHAAIVTQVTELDETIVLLEDQRTALVKRLTKIAEIEDAWERHGRSPPPTGAQRFPAAVSAGDLGGLAIADEELAAVLWAAQFMGYKQLRTQAVRQVILAGKQRQIIVAGGGNTVDEEMRRLTIRLDRMIDTADAVSRLSDQQRQKLRLAGKLDIDQFHDRYLAIASASNAEPVETLARHTALAEAAHQRFVDPTSNFQKTVRAHLTASQKAMLDEAARARDAFRRHALVEAAVVGFERCAALTSAQCAALTHALDDAMADYESTVNWRVDCLRTISALPEKTLRTIVADEQWPAVERHQETLAKIADHLEYQAAQKLAAIHGIDIGVERPDGRLELEFRADELKLKLD